MKTYYVTFGVKYHRESHPWYGGPIPENGYVRVYANDYESARAAVTREIDLAWAFIYSEEEFAATAERYPGPCIAVLSEFHEGEYIGTRQDLETLAERLTDGDEASRSMVHYIVRSDTMINPATGLIARDPIITEKVAEALRGSASTQEILDEAWKNRGVR